MGKLLQLATHCIDDVQFYGSQGKRKPSIKWDNDLMYDSKYVLTKVSVNFINNNKPFKSYNEQSNIVAKINRKYCPENNSISPAYHNQLIIKFEDEPPVHIFYMHVLDEASTVTGRHDEKERYLFFFKRTISRDYQCTIHKYKHRFVIQCGSIMEDITLEQYTTLIEKYRSNLTRLENECDQAKIDKRLKEYE